MAVDEVRRPIHGQQATAAFGQPAWWWSWCTFSVFAFANPGLEKEFQQYLTNSTNVSTWVICAEVIAAWLMIASKLYSFPKEHGSLPGNWVTGLLHPLLAVAILGITALMPVFYRNHQRVLKPIFLCCFMVPLQSARGALLWMKYVDVKHGSSQTWFQQVQSFSVENIHLFGAARLVQSFPMGLIPDLISTNIFMALVMTGNRHICALPHLGDSLVTMSPGLLSATQVASVWLSGVAVPAPSIHPASRKLSCPAALGFWQLLGSLLACVNVFVADIFRRRAFLRTPEARARLGRELEPADLSWPFGNRPLIEKGVAIGFCLSCLWASVVWNTALNFWSSQEV
eukprot:jgi/Botrbrau1/15844/Bobra.40_1s0028.1